jgi:hypothetical protein
MIALMDNKFTGNDGACNTLDNVTKSIHLTVALPITDWDVPSAIRMLSGGVK